MANEKPIRYAKLAQGIIFSSLFILIGIYLIRKKDGFRMYIGYADVIFFSVIIIFSLYKIIRSISSK